MGFLRKNKTIEDLLPAFLLEREMLANTLTSEAYRSHIYVFVHWLDDIGLKNIAVHKITDQHIASFFVYLAKEKHLDRSTCEKYFLHIRSFFQFAEKRDDVDRVPFNLVVLPKQHNDKSAEVIHPDHLKAILKEAKEKDPQLFLAAMILYYCFIRPGKELRLMKVGDIDMENGMIKVIQANAKNNKRQVVTMPSQLIDICREYGVDTADRTLYIFGNKRKFGTKTCSINMLKYRFNLIRDRLNLPKGYKFYSFKHTGATSLHMSGLSMRELMDQLRHTKLEATEHYLKIHSGIVNPRIRNNFPNPIE